MLQRKHFTESKPRFTNQARSRARRRRSVDPLKNRGSRSPKVSARNLAASIWRQQMQEEAAISAAHDGGYRSRGDESEFQYQIETSSFHLSNALDLESSINSDFTSPQKNRRSSKAFGKILRSDYEEDEDVNAFVLDLNSELNLERVSRKRLEMVNFELVHQLAEAELGIKWAMNRYETERKKKELMEELCELLDRGIEEEKDKANIMHTRLRKVRADVEEERNMNYMGKAWREEQVHMKLMAAKDEFEEKYCQLSDLVADLERFLELQCGNDDDLDEIELERFIVSSPSSILRHIGAIVSHREGNAIDMKKDEIMHTSTAENDQY